MTQWQTEESEILTEIRDLLKNMQPEPLQPIQVSQTTVPPLKCYACVERYFLAELDIKNGVLHDGQAPVLPDINDAETWGPCWTQRDIGGGMIVWACITLPSCHKHLKKEEETPAQRATRSGLALPGSGGIN